MTTPSGIGVSALGSGRHAPIPTAIAIETPEAHDEPEPPARTAAAQLASAILWLILAGPGIYQIALLAIAIAGRITYPYDLEWMEGGMLHHALRIANGDGIYVPPSIEFIPYLYTPLYPSLLALFGSAFGLSYVVGRGISVLSLIGITVIGYLSLNAARHRHATAGPALAGTVLGIGLFAACYPFVEGWYDLVRADTLFLFLVTAAIAGLSRWTRTTTGLPGHLKVAAGGAMLALAFFCKQTGIFYVAFGGLVVLVLAWRRVPIYVLAAGAIGLGGTLVLDNASDGWFWIYIQKVHAAHDFNMDRFWKSFSNVLWHFPAMTLVIAGALLLVVLAWVIPPADDDYGRPRRRRLPPQAAPLLLWTAMYLVSTVVGAVGWGTEWAHFNAYMPAFLHGGLAAGAAIPAVVACGRHIVTSLRGSAFAIAAAGSLFGIAAAVPLGVVLIRARWNPDAFVPSHADEAAGDKLVARLAAMPGEIWMPSHPWYLQLAGKTPRVHRMGIKDVTDRKPRPIAGLDEAVTGHEFAAIVFDGPSDLHDETQPELQKLRAELHDYYRPAIRLPADERPRVYTGARATPDEIWMPAVPAVPPAGVHVLFDFEATTWADGWIRDGAAWAIGPLREAEHAPTVYGRTGHHYATSALGGDQATGRMTSPPFVIPGARITMQLGGGADATKLRVELWVDDAIVRTASVPMPGGDAQHGDAMHEVAWDVADQQGKTATIVLIDEATTPGGHLDVDDVWLW